MIILTVPINFTASRWLRTGCLRLGILTVAPEAGITSAFLSRGAWTDEIEILCPLVRFLLWTWEAGDAIGILLCTHLLTVT